MTKYLLAMICKNIYCVSFRYVMRIKRLRNYITRMTLLAHFIYFCESWLQWTKLWILYDCNHEYNYKTIDDTCIKKPKDYMASIKESINFPHKITLIF